MSEEEIKTVNVRVVSNREEIPALNANESAVHLTFRPSGKDFVALMQRCPLLRTIYMPQSYLKTVSNTFKHLMKNNRISVERGEAWGHRTDIDKYVEMEIGGEYAMDIAKRIKIEGE